MRKAYYIGRITHGSGGVSSKNNSIYNELIKYIDIEKVDLTAIKHGSIKYCFKVLLALSGRNNTIIVGTAGDMRRKLSHYLYLFRKNTLHNSILMVMGGQFGNIIAADPDYRKWVKGYKAIYVETQGMLDTLNSCGVNNAALFPNCRKKPETTIFPHKRTDRLKCVCFSMIYPEKGIDTVLEVTEKMPDVDFDFWGSINEDYKKEFLADINKCENAHYQGVFKVDGDNVYHMLSQYDVLLFPTRMASEGVPGTLIEAKISALPALVSNVAYNAQLVTDGYDGIVLEENTSSCIAKHLKDLQNDDERLTRIKFNAIESGKNYYFEKYIMDIVENIRE